MIVQRTVTYAVCPSCGRDAGIVDHLLGRETKTAWYCDHCGQRYSLSFSVSTVDITALPGERKVKTADLTDRVRWWQTAVVWAILLAFFGAVAAADAWRWARGRR